MPGGLYNRFGLSTPLERDNYVTSAAHDGEEHEIVDFMVGKDIGVGAFAKDGRSTLSAGLRYANFKSTSRVSMVGLTGSYISPIVEKYTGAQRYDFFNNTLESTREFEGSGPAVTWESSIRLAGGDAGHADLDWKVGGGVLFGRQTVDSYEDRLGANYDFEGGTLFGTLVETLHYDDLVPRTRTNDVTVPNLSLGLGLSYTIDRVKVSTGYAYDRFFDVIDGGYKAAKDYDRTIHGPYLKLSLGFGG